MTVPAAYREPERTALPALQGEGMPRSTPEFDIELSFAGEDRPYVDSVANLLRDRGVTVFYDLFHEETLWGKNLYDYLTEIYLHKARFTIMFISTAYATRLWPNVERQAMQARAFQEAAEYVLPARFDDTDIPGVLPTTGYISLRGRSALEFVELVLRKLVNSGATMPSEQLRRSFSTIRRIPRVDPAHLLVRVQAPETFQPIVGARVVALAENNTTLGGTTNEEGLAVIEIPTRRNYRVLVAHPEYPGAICDRVDPAESLQVLLPPSENIGSLIVHGTGHIPGLSGRLNPILDTSHRTYLYAENIAINGGVQQPAHFAMNEPIELEDANGAVFLTTVKLIAGRTSLLQYVKLSYVDHVS